MNRLILIMLCHIETSLVTLMYSDHLTGQMLTAKFKASEETNDCSVYIWAMKVACYKLGWPNVGVSKIFRREYGHIISVEADFLKL